MNEDLAHTASGDSGVGDQPATDDLPGHAVKRCAETEGSQLFGVSIRSWCAMVLVGSGQLTLFLLIVYLAMTGKPYESALAIVASLMSGAMGYLFGKSAGRGRNDP